jgi:hypothetical protein
LDTLTITIIHAGQAYGVWLNVDLTEAEEIICIAFNQTTGKSLSGVLLA